MGTRRCTGRRSTTICRPSLHSSSPAHRWTSRPTTAGGPFAAVQPVGQCRRRCRRCPQEHAAAYSCPLWPRRCSGRAHQRRRGHDHQEHPRVCLCGGAAGAAGWASTAAGAAVARRNTPLHLAAESRNADVAAALIGAGADATVKNIDGYAALRCAAPHGRPPQPQPGCPQEDGRATMARTCADNFDSFRILWGRF
jgi:hypothetical protein